MNIPNLLLNIHPLHILGLFQLPIIIQRRPLPPRLLLLADNRLTCHTVENIRTLRGKPLEISCYVGGGEVGGLGAGVGFEALFFPAGVEEFDCRNMLTCML
jgi:hypothetical protein